ncbi:MAG TPA: M20/M25/M40 family metallo-hydrolase, partial [Gemmatimonadales bacterium]|nr:M20/M25/M40 family metallo-hydrolase [Gemmatimonadales bacterium]
GVGTAGLAAAGQYVADGLRAPGARPGGTAGSYFQNFVIDPSAPGAMHSNTGGDTTRNVVAVLRGTSLPGEVVVVGAHYDHLGRGGFGALDDPDSTGKIHNGADDNASGTAAVMEIARRLAGSRHARTIVLLAFSGEELGDLGSEYFVKHPLVEPVDSIYAMVNLDMVGRLRNEKLLASGAATAKEFPALLDSLNRTADGHFDLRASGDGWGPSDHASFYAAKRPVLFFFTDLHEDYHKSTDDWQKINAAGLARVAAFAGDAVLALANRPAPLTFVDAPQPQTSMGGAGYGAYLGTIPDMSESPGGVRISGVRAASPAEKAGLQSGDVITAIGAKTVANLYDMTDALRAHQPGDTVTIVVQRAGARLTLTAVLGKRGG